MKRKVMSVFGTRPEAIKMAPLALELGKREGIISQVCVTAQHRQMLDSVMDCFHLKADYDLNIMGKNQTLTDVTSRVLNGLPAVLEDAFKQNPKAILICNPSNPSGKVFTYDELKLIADLCIKYDVYAIMDEVYEHIIYDGHKHIYMNSLPGMWERTVSCSSLSKTYSITGWRLGYAIAPQHIMDRIKQYHDFNTVGAPSPLMEAAVVGLEMPDSYYKEFGDHYAHMKKLFTEGLDRIGIPYTDPQGAYFVLANIGPYMKPGQTDVQFCEEMAAKVGVACVPGSSFFKENVGNIVRVHFAKKDETLNEALNRLSDIRRKIPPKR